MSMMREPEDGGRAWRERWVANVQALARRQIPAWLQDLRMEPLREQQSPASPTEIIPRDLNPSTPLPPSPRDTGPIVLPTRIIPIVKLLPIDVRDTRELVSSAVRWFFDRHGQLPTTIGLNPLRCLAICSRDYFPVECDDIGCYTVRIEQNATLACDVVECRGRRYVWEEEVADWYL